ncbi:hypothetical protein LZ198_19130 [Myxococcus sp. K15C18031901]|uniref:hypothetical protein n=1 Tax=Myxococcus dinghuensis TaxID=2906761 RepID=UPI0020A78696|nr:hypothetical protein [Myxococcus dinghuensis]MCP3100991.1 hypothetical protein [Myxococcus dinghuensis]
MKNLRSALLFAVSLSTAACAVDPVDMATPEALEALGTTSQRAIVVPPPISNYCPGVIPGTPWNIPTAPTPLSSIPAGTPLYPAASNPLSAYTVVVTDPNNSGGFWAFGFDVRAHRLQFWVSGALTEIRRFNSQLATDITLLEVSTGTDLGFSWGTSGQVGGPLIPRPGVAEGAWRVAYDNYYQLDAYLVSPTEVPAIQ